MKRACLLLAFALTGCAPHTSERGVRVGDETLKQFKAGTTTEAWLVAVLGPPTASSLVDGVENTRVLRYVSTEESSGFLSVFTGGSSRNRAVTYFIVTDGVVTRFWSDRATEHTALGTKVESDPGSTLVH